MRAKLTDKPENSRGVTIDQLMKKGRKGGKSGYETIAQALDQYEELDSDEINDPYQNFEDQGIDLIDDGDKKEKIGRDKRDKRDDLSVPKGISVDDLVRMCLKEIGKISLLTADEEMAIVKKMENGGGLVKQELVEANFRLVISIARRCAGRRMGFLDLIQKGDLDLMKVIEEFGHTKSFRSSTYAIWWICQTVTRTIADQARTIRIPVHMIRTIDKLVHVQRQLVQDLERDPSPGEIAQKMNLDVEKVREIQKTAQEPVNLEIPVGEEEDSHLGDFIPDDEVLSPVDAATSILLKEQLDAVLITLTEREKKILILRFGLEGDRARTLGEMGKGFDVIRERIR